MNKIDVLFERHRYYWVDTVIKHDEFEYVCAVLVNPRNGIVFSVEISNIKVMDNDFRTM